MGYSFDIVSLIFLATIYLCFVFRGTRYCVGKRWLNAMLLLSSAYMIVMIMLYWNGDISSGIFVAGSRHPIAYVYLINVIILAPVLYLYFTDLCEERGIRLWKVFLVPAIELLLLATNEWHHQIFYFSEDGSYTLNRFVILLYLSYVIYFILICIKVYRHRVRLGRKICSMLAVLIVFLTLIQIIQLKVTNVLFQSVSCSVTLMYIMVIVYMVDNHYDDVTGIHNKEGFLCATRELLNRNPDETYLMIRLDIINFQDVNEQFGYATGDKVLKYIAQFLRKNCSEESEIGHLGADDFAGFIPEKDFRIFAMHSNIEVFDNSIKMNYDLMYSVGIYRVRDKDMDISLMLDRAEFALLQMQKNCREHIQYFDEDMEKKFMIEKYMVHEMYHALNNNCFEVYIQPIVKSKTKEISSGEAMLRWNDSKYGIIPRDIYKPLFEKNSFITELNRYTIEKVCRYISVRRERGENMCPISVNVSKADIQSSKFIDDVGNIMNEYSIKPEDLTFEVTEQAFDGMNNQILQNVKKIHDLGYSITMDDFGSGYSNFNNFSRMPVDMVKTDISFITDLEQSQKGMTVMQNIINMTRELSMPMIIEGVDSEGQYSFLKKLDCEHLQGFFFSRPVSLEKFSEMLNMAARKA